MAVTTTMAQASIASNAFYAPQYKLSIQGQGLPSSVLRDIVEINYHDKIDEIDNCELTVNNWDADARQFKYIGSDSFDSNGNATPNNPNWTMFDPCNRTVELYLGYSGKLERMITATFTTLEPNFPASGPPALQVRMLNYLHKLRSTQYSGSWGGKTDSFIAKDIAKKRDPKTGQPRFPLPIVVNDKASAAEPPIDFVVQNNQYDVDFLWHRARVHGYDVLIRGEQDKQELYFGPSGAPERPTYQLEWGQSLIDFKATVTTANQYKSVTVCGWDRAAQKEIKEKVDYTDPELKKLNRNLQHLVQQCDPREEMVKSLPVFTRAEARKRALAIFQDQAHRFVKASGTTVGLPLLRAGAKVQIGKSLGSRLSGTYFVTGTQHTFNNSGYTTRFEARREDYGELE